MKRLKQTFEDLKAGGRAFAKATEGIDYGLTFAPFTKASRKAYSGLKEQGVTTKTPVKLAGALATSAVTDLGYDATRVLYWKNNHPMPISDSLSRLAQGKNINQYSAPQKAVIGLASVGLPVGASLGIYDLTNPGELFRPKGFAQSYAEQGSEDRRQTGQPAPELLERFVLGRQGRPLKFDTAKEDLPDLTKQRYANYMNFLYNDKGPLGVGLIKGTMENLRGEPEARIVGFPVGLQAVGALAGSSAATAAALRSMPPGKVEKKGKAQTIVRPSAKRVPTAQVAAAGAGGALVGALAGKLMNRALASQGQSDLPSTQEYGITPERTFNGVTPEGELVMAAIRGYGPYDELEKVGLNTPEKLEQRRQELMQLYSATA